MIGRRATGFATGKASRHERTGYEAYDWMRKKQELKTRYEMAP
jgi:hypothetical protein